MSVRAKSTPVRNTKEQESKVKAIKNNLDLLPERWQDNKQFPRENIKFVDNQGFVLVNYKDTGSMGILDIFADGNPTQLVENPSPILCKQAASSNVISFHENGVLQIYDVVDGTVQRVKEPALLKLLDARQKPGALAFDQENIALIYQKKIMLYDRTQRRCFEYDFEKQVTAGKALAVISPQERFCVLRSPLLMIGTYTTIQIWDLTDATNRVPALIFQYKVENRTNTFIHVHWSQNMLLACTTDTMKLFNLSESMEEAQTMSTDVITALYMDHLHIISADKNGMISARHTKTGVKFGDLTDVASRDNLDNRINAVETYQHGMKHFVIAAHENNMISVWDLDKMKQRVPVDRYWTTGPVKDMMVNTGEIVVRVKPNDGTSTLLMWVPNLDKPAAKTLSNPKMSDKDLILACLYGSSTLRGRSDTVTQVEMSDAPEEEVQPEPEPDAVFTGTYIPPDEMEAAESTKLFGAKLNEVLARRSEQNSGIPTVVKQMVQFIANEGLWTKDIFKLPRPKKQLEDVIAQIDKGENINWYNLTPTTVGDLLKQYLMDLPEPLLTWTLYPQFIQAATLPLEKRKPEVIRIFGLVPPSNKVLCEVILALLARVAENKQSTMMTTPALGAIFGQIILSPELPAQKIPHIPKINILGKDLIEFIGIPLVEFQKKEGLIVDEAKQAQAPGTTAATPAPAPVTQPNLMELLLIDMKKPAPIRIQVDPTAEKHLVGIKSNVKTLSARQRGLLESIVKVSEEQVKLLNTKLSNIQDQLSTTTSLKVVMSIARIIHNTKSVIVDGREATKGDSDVATDEDTNSSDYQNKLLLTKKIIEGSIKTIRERLFEILDNMRNGSEMQRAEYFKKASHVIHLTTLALLAL